MNIVIHTQRPLDLYNNIFIAHNVLHGMQWENNQE